MLPQTDGRTLRRPRGEIYLQIITAENGGRGGDERVESGGQITEAKRARRRGTEREARTEPGCA